METEPKIWRIRVTRPFYHAGAAQQVGAVLSVAYPFARELIANNKAERVLEPEPLPAEPEAAPAAEEPQAKATRKARATA